MHRYIDTYEPQTAEAQYERRRGREVAGGRFDPRYTVYMYICTYIHIKHKETRRGRGLTGGI